MTLYPRLMKAAADTPWALAPVTLAILGDVLRFRASGQRLTDDEIRSRILQYSTSERRRDKHAASPRYFDTETDDVFAPAFDSEGDFIGYRSQSGAAMQAGRPVVAVISVFGVVMQRADMLDEMSGAMSIDTLTKRFRAALSDPAVRGIVFDVDSPGGGVYGVQELATEIREARDIKPIAAIADSLAASAAYWILTAAGDCSVTPSGEVGSIGVYSLHQDISELLKKEGISYEFISAGDFKTEGNPFEPLTEEARAFMQSRVNDYYGDFLKAVAKGRGITIAKVKADFGQGRAFGAVQAKEAGMVDRIETLDDTVRRIAGKKPGKGAGPAAAAGAGSPAWAELNAARVDAERLIHGL